MTSSFYLAGLKIIMALAFGLATSQAQENRIFQSSAPVDAKYFGLHMHHTLNASNATPWPSVKFGTWRLWDAYVQWYLLEPKKGQWDFSKLDKYVAMAEQHGVEVLLPLGLTPQWASARPNEKSAYTPGNAAEAAKMEDWRNYVRTVATRYKGRIHHYELWNEVNLPMFYTGSTKRLVELAQEMFIILKEVDSSNIVVSPSITGDYGKDWFDKYLQDGGGNYADVIGFHFYVPTQEPEVIPNFVQDIRTIMGRHGLTKLPLWNTEAGWHIANTDGSSEVGAPGKWKRLQPDEAANYVARALILGRVGGLDRFYWYAWDNTYMGFVEPKNKSIKPAGKAYGQVYEWLVGNILKGCTQNGDLWICDGIRADRTMFQLVWTTGEDRSWQPPAIWAAERVQNLGGKWSSIALRQSLLLTQSPALYTK